MYKLIACDLDETLLSDNSRVPEKNIAAIQKAIEHGVKFVPATGRGYKSINKTLEELNLLGKDDEYIISFNGGAIVENKDYKVLKFHGLDFDIASNLFNFGIKHDVCIHVYTAENVYVFNINSDEEKYIKDRLKGFITCDKSNIDFLKDIPISKMLFENLDRNYLIKIEENIKDITDNKVTVTYSSNRYIEFNSIGVNKGTAIIELGNLLGISKDEIIAIGDNFNDLSMLEAAGLSVAVNNAVPAIKSKVNYVCDSTNNEGAVAEVIDKFILN